MKSVLREKLLDRGLRMSIGGLCAAFTGLSGPAFATANVTSPVIGMNTYTAASAAPASPVTVIFLATNLPTSTENCPAHSPNNAIFLNMSDPQAATLYATLLSGFMTGQSMQIGVSGCSSSGFPVVYSVQVGSQTPTS